jgi:threonine/homoserine/homoserine lactone efflux protein
MTLTIWAFFILTETALCLTPGPAVLFVVSQALKHGAVKSLWAIAGILSGNAFYFLLSATGLGAVLLASHRLFICVKWVGAVYLVYLGVRTFIDRGGAAIGGPVAKSGLGDVAGARFLLRGFAVQASNPKALVFFTALLPQFINPAAPVAFQLLILGVSSLAVEFLVLGGYGVLAGRASAFAGRPRFVQATNRVSGSLLIAAGAGLALTESK